MLLLIGAFILIFQLGNGAVNTLNEDCMTTNYLEGFFRYSDPDGRVYMLDNLASPKLLPENKYEYKGYPPPETGWRVSLADMERLDQEGRLHFPKSKTGRIQGKRYRDEAHLVEGRGIGFVPLSYQVAASALPAIYEAVSIHPGVLSLLMEIPQQLRRYFASEPITLEAHTDPETGERSILVAVDCFKLQRSIEDAWPKFEAFRQEWWLENAQRADHKVMVDIR